MFSTKDHTSLYVINILTKQQGVQILILTYMFVKFHSSIRFTFFNYARRNNGRTERMTDEKGEWIWLQSPLKVCVCGGSGIHRTILKKTRTRRSENGKCEICRRNLIIKIYIVYVELHVCVCCLLFQKTDGWHWTLCYDNTG